MRSKISAALFIFFLITSSVCFSATYRWRFEDNGDSTTVSWRDGGIIQVAGDLDGATVALQWYLVIDPVAGDPGWIAISPCDAIVSAGLCEFRVGAGSIKVSVSGGGASLDVWIGITEIKIGALSTSGGAADWDTIAGGTSAEDFLVTTGGSFAPDGSGTVTATSARALANAAGTTSMTVDGSGDIQVSVDSASAWEFFNGGADMYFGSSGDAGVNGPLMMSESASSTNPVFIPNRNETNRDSGMGWAGQGQPNIIADGVQVFLATSSYGSVLGCKNFGKLSTAPSGAACDRYFDTDLGLWCTYTGADWKDDFTGLVTCS